MLRKGETRYSSGTTPTDYQYTGQYSYAGEFGLLFYNARWYDPALGRFAQADTIIPSPGNPQAWDKYAYTLNNPVIYNDPSGHISCYDMDGGGSCQDTKEVKQLNQLFDYLDRQILGRGQNSGSQKKSLEFKPREVMEMIVNHVAIIYGNDWDKFLRATSLVFTGVYERGATTMWSAHRSGNAGFIDGGADFHLDFRDVDNSQQVRHFWAGFATAADPLGDNPLGITVATVGNDFHDNWQDTRGGDDGVTVMDYRLTVTAIDIARHVGEVIRTPSDLVGVLHDRLSPSGPGYLGPPVDPARWYTPYD